MRNEQRISAGAGPPRQSSVSEPDDDGTSTPETSPRDPAGQPQHAADRLPHRGRVLFRRPPGRRDQRRMEHRAGLRGQPALQRRGAAHGRAQGPADHPDLPQRQAFGRRRAGTREARLLATSATCSRVSRAKSTPNTTAARSAAGVCTACPGGRSSGGKASAARDQSASYLTARPRARSTGISARWRRAWSRPLPRGPPPARPPAAPGRSARRPVRRVLRRAVVASRATVREASSLSHWNSSLSSPTSAVRAITRFFGAWNCSQSRSRAKRASAACSGATSSSAGARPRRR